MSVSKDWGSQISLLKFGVVCVKENGVNTKVVKLTFLTRSTAFQIQIFPSKKLNGNIFSWSTSSMSTHNNIYKTNFVLKTNLIVIDDRIHIYDLLDFLF